MCDPVTLSNRRRWTALWAAACLAALTIGCQAPTQTIATADTTADLGSGFSVDVVDTAGSGDTGGPADTSGASDTSGSKDTLADLDTSDLQTELPVDAVDVAEPDGSIAVDGAVTGSDGTTADGGSGDSSTTDTASTCADSEKWCPTAFTYSGKGDEGSVEVRGSWNG